MYVVLLAEARVGAELQAAQRRGEVERAGGDRLSNVRGSDNAPVSLPEIGIPRQRAAEMKQLAAAGPEAIEAEITTAKSEGRRPSRTKMAEPTAHYHLPRAFRPCATISRPGK